MVPVPEHRLCSYNIGTNKDPVYCQEPAVRHIRWGREAMHSYACEKHKEAALVFKGELASQYHQLGGCCGMPGFSWHVEMNMCILPDGLPVMAEKKERELAPA